MKIYNPTTPGRRGMTGADFDEITSDRPHKALVFGRSGCGGRNNQGRLTVRHRGGGHKRLVRILDWKRDKHDVPALVETIEYDPNRSARIALLVYADGERRYILAPKGLAVGEKVSSGPKAEIRVGAALPLTRIPLGTVVHAIEMRPGAGACLARSAGTSTQLLAREKGTATLRLPSGEMRRVPDSCYATIGVVGNEEHENIQIGKAGRKRWMGIRPTVRGVVMNPCDHPHGGGEGKAPQGNPHPVSPWGWNTKGKKTRKDKKASNRFILSRRKK